MRLSDIEREVALEKIRSQARKLGGQPGGYVPFYEDTGEDEIKMLVEFLREERDGTH